jgi:hypothetical protein
LFIVKILLKYVIKPIALYLPQFHPIPENDHWWGSGFTEWTNVTKAKPLFKEHWQPRLPADLGFYDLRVPEARHAQAELARKYGIYGFCYWHYWFGGKRLLERPLKEVVQSGNPDFPFCIAWANQTWSGTWHGLSNNKVLVEQTYLGIQDYTQHFYALLDTFQDPRYIEVNGKKLVFIFRPMDIPDPQQFIDCWQNLAVREGLEGLHMVGMHMESGWQPDRFGYDAMVQTWLNREHLKHRSFTEKIKGRMYGMLGRQVLQQRQQKPLVVSYARYVKHYTSSLLNRQTYPMVYANWDNTPRSGRDGWLFHDFSPALFQELCFKAMEATANKPDAEKFMIIKSWNEWAEGNYMEPDQRYGHATLQAFYRALQRYEAKQNDQPANLLKGDKVNL